MILQVIVGLVLFLTPVVGYLWGSATARRRRLWKLDHRGLGPLAAEDERPRNPQADHRTERDQMTEQPQPPASAATIAKRLADAEKIIRALMTPHGVLYTDGRQMVAAYERRYKVALTGMRNDR